MEGRKKVPKYQLTFLKERGSTGCASSRSPSISLNCSSINVGRTQAPQSANERSVIKTLTRIRDQLVHFLSFAIALLIIVWCSRVESGPFASPMPLLLLPFWISWNGVTDEQLHLCMAIRTNHRRICLSINVTTPSIALYSLTAESISANLLTSTLETNAHTTIMCHRAMR